MSCWNGWVEGRGKPAKLLSPPLLSRVHCPRKTSSLQGPKQSSRQCTHELIQEERSPCPKASMWLEQVLCWAGEVTEVDQTPSEPVYGSDLVLPPCDLLGDKTSLCPCTEQVTGPMSMCQLSFWANSAGQEGTEWGFSLATA